MSENISHESATTKIRKGATTKSIHEEHQMPGAGVAWFHAQPSSIVPFILNKKVPLTLNSGFPCFKHSAQCPKQLSRINKIYLCSAPFYEVIEKRPQNRFLVYIFLGLWSIFTSFKLSISIFRQDNRIDKIISKSCWFYAIYNYAMSTTICKV